MMYKSKYEVILMVEDKKILEKEIEISKIVKEFNILEEKIRTEEEKNNLFRSLLEKKDTNLFMAFGGVNNYEYVKTLKEQIEKINIELNEKRKEFLKLKEKRKIIEEMDKEEEKKYYDELKKIEQKKLISMKINMEKRGDDNE